MSAKKVQKTEHYKVKRNCGCDFEQESWSHRCSLCVDLMTSNYYFDNHFYHCYASYVMLSSPYMMRLYQLRTTGLEHGSVKE